MMPSRPRLDAALARIGGIERAAAIRYPLRIGRPAASELPWLPVPAADLALLGQDREQWLTSKVTSG